MKAHVPKSKCSYCNTVLDGAMSDGIAPVQPGDLSICRYCGHLSAFGDDLRLRPLTDQEMHAIAGNPKLIQMQNFLARERRRNGREQRK
jgi:hypothetical protein